MRGTDARTGAPLAGAAHLRQSIRDILTTPIGSRVMRRTYGSRVFDLLDAPLDAAGAARVVAAAAEAIATWEPRYRVERIQVAAASRGHFSFDLDGAYVPEGTPLAIRGLVV